MALLNTFRTFDETIPFSGSVDELRSTLDTVTTFEENPPKSWRYHFKGKPFNGYMKGPEFLLIQRPMMGVRFGPVIKGTLVSDTPRGPCVVIKGWIDPRAKTKIIFGFLISVFIIARMAHDFSTTGKVFDTNSPDGVLPFFLIAALPITIYASVLYNRSRVAGFKEVTDLFKPKV